MCLEKDGVMGMSKRTGESSASFMYVIYLTHSRFLEIWPYISLKKKISCVFAFVKHFMGS